jgi:hypothetical protein
MIRNSGKFSMVALAGLLAISLLSVVSYSEEPQEKPKTGKLNDDLWVEVKAQLLYEVGKVTDKYGITPETPEAARKSLQEMEAASNKVYGRFGVTKEEVDAYYEKIAKEDVQRAMKLSQLVAKRAEALHEKDRKPEPEAQYVKYLPDIPVLPGSKLNPESTKEVIWYETKASEKEAFSFYKDKLSKDGWKCYSTEFSLYFIKGDKAFELSMPSGEGELQYRPLPPKRAISESVMLKKDDYIAKVVIFAEKLLPYSQKVIVLSKEVESRPSQENLEKMEEAREELDTVTDEIAPEVGVTLSRLQDFNKNYALELMDYLLKNPGLKERGIPAFLGRLEYWDALGSAVEDYASKNPKQAEMLMKRYQNFATEWMTPWF